jgi:predicted Zn-dependent protease
MTKRGMRRLMILATGFVVAAAGLTGAYLVRESMLRTRAAEDRARGLELFKAEEFKTALDPLGRAIGYDRSDVELLKAYATCRKEVPLPNGKHLFQAIAWANAATDLAPSDMEAKRILLDLYLSVGYALEAIELSGEMLALDPGDRYARVVQIGVLLDTDRIDEATTRAQAYVDRSPEQLEAHGLLVDCMIKAGADPKERLAYALSLSDLYGFSQRPDYQAWLTEIAARAEDVATAEAAARRAASLPPSSAETTMYIIELLLRLDRYLGTSGGPGTADPEAGSRATLAELADDLLERALADPSIGQTVAGRAARRAWWANDRDRAAEFVSLISPDPSERPATPGTDDATEPLQENADDERAKTMLWASLVLIGERPGSGHGLDDPAVSAYAETLAGTVSYTLLEAMDALRSARPEAAVEVLSTFTPTGRDEGALSAYLRGVAMQRIGDYRGATTAFRESAESPGIPRDRAWRALGDVFTSIGQLDEARRAYMSMSDRSNRKLPQVDSVLAELERRQGTAVTRQEQQDNLALTRQLIGILERMNEETSGNASVQARLAHAYLIDHDLEAGIPLAQRLVNADPPPDPIGTLGLARALEKFAPGVGNDLRATLTERTDSIELLASNAAQIARDGDLARARELLEGQLEGRTPAEALPYRRAIVRVLDAFDGEQALEQTRRLSDDYPESSTAQLSVLATRAIWTDPDAARTAVTRLGETMGTDTPTWKTYNARATLDREPSDEELSEVQRGLASVLQESPDDFDALILSARAHVARAKLAREANPGADVDAFIDLAAAKYAVASGPRVRAAAFRPLIDLLLDEGRFAEANRELDRFMELETGELQTRFRLQRRDLLVRAGRWAEAAEEQRDLMSYDEPESVLGTAELYIRAGEASQAAEIIEGFLAAEDWPAAQRESAADLLADAGYAERAIEVFRGLGDEHEGEPIEAVIARAMTRNGRLDLALGSRLKAVRGRGELSQWLEAIRLAIGLDDAATLDRVLAEAREAYPDSEELRSFSVDSPTRRTAAASLPVTEQEAIGTEAGDALLEVLRTHALGATEPGAYLEGLERVTDGYPAFRLGWQIRIESLLRTGRTDEAARVCRASVEALPDSEPLLERAASILRGVGDLDGAAVLAARLIERTRPDSFEAELTLAQIELDRGAFARVIDLLAKHRSRLASASEAGPAPGLAVLAVAYAGAGYPGETEDLLLTPVMRRNQPEWQEPLLLAARILPVEERDTARRWLDRIDDPRLAAQVAEAWLSIATYSGKSGDIDRVLGLATEDRTSSSVDWLWIRARALALTERTDEAEAALRAVADAAPGEAVVRVALADLLSRVPERAADTIRVVEDTRGLLPPTIQDQRLMGVLFAAEARALLAQSRTTEAIGLLEPLVDNGSTEPEVLVLLATAYLKEGSLNEAASTLAGIRDPELLNARTRAVFVMVQGGLTDQ